MRNRKNLSFLRSVSMALLCFLTLLPSGRAVAENMKSMPVLTDFAEKRIAVMEGTIQEDMIRDKFPKADIKLFNAVTDMPLALESGIVDAFIGDAYIVGEILRNKPSLMTVDTPIGQVEAALAFPKTDAGAHLRDQMNDFLHKCAKDGTLLEMSDIWFSDRASESRVDMSGLPGTGPELNFATTGIAIPFSFFENGEVHGFDIDLVVRFCREYNYHLNIETMSFPSIIPGLVSGKYDLAGNGIFVTEERKENVYFSDIYRTMNIVLVTEKPGAETVSEGFFSTLITDFEKSFLREDRWKMVLSGMQVTLSISVAAVTLGTVLGFGLCMLRRMKSKVIHGFTSVYIRILQGTPQLVMLMILFYLVFADTNLPGEWVAIISFSLNFSAYSCEILRTGIDAVDIGQTEAALALGYTKWQTFFKVVMPQVIGNILPVYQGEVISLIKLTSIVGYIAVQDLTKVTDIIRSRTYQAFFPLITTAVLYFILSGAITLVLKAIQKQFTPKRASNARVHA